MSYEIYEYGNEFSINRSGLFYPAYMTKDQLNNFAFHFAREIIGELTYVEVKVAQIDDGKGLTWEFIEYAEDTSDKKIVWLWRKYTFSMYPSWKIGGYHDHWLSGRTPRCQTALDTENTENRLQGIVNKIQQEMIVENNVIGYGPQLDRFLSKNRNWTHIITFCHRSFASQPRKINKMTKEIREYAKQLRKRKDKEI
ncbi:hypothetical protein [Chitinophaga varians]|uniref:hypothetical protein n=1 Tax=Chitinophaga varians TaxID=2202339 RepID=UPI00165FB2AF|nr:hypothetical protein [Chitinophaga varians]MBC9912760.1 hypothetical protein [Chitinophaga varians]